MFLLKFILTLILFYYLGRVLWRVLLMGAAHKQMRFMHKSSAQNETYKGQGESKISIGQMVACARCGTYVTEERALIRNGKAYCTQTCSEEKQ